MDGTGSIGVLAIGIDAEKHLTVLDWVRVLGNYLLDDTIELRFDLVHDLHRLDDAENLALGDAIPDAEVRLGAGLGSGIVRPHHRRLDFEQVRPRRLRLRGRSLWCSRDWRRRGRCGWRHHL